MPSFEPKELSHAREQMANVGIEIADHKIVNYFLINLEITYY